LDTYLLTDRGGEAVEARFAVHCHRRCTHVSLAAVFGMNVLEHRLGSQRSWISSAFVKVLDTNCVRAGQTDEGRTPMVSTDSVHN
jgi:hypothetical protein